MTGTDGASSERDNAWPGSPAVEGAYDALLASIGQRAGEIVMPLTSHWPLFGNAYDHGPLIVGQSLFGWVHDWSPDAAQTETGRAAILAESKRAMRDRTDPMDWLETSDVRGSPWWSACRLLVETLSPGSTPWYARFGWANLFPVAPAAFKSNPYGVLKEAQDAHVGQLIGAIVEAVQPSAVIALGGPFWWPCAGLPRFAALRSVPRPLMFAGEVAGRPWVVGWHPGGAQRRHYPPAPYAALIAEAIRGGDSH